MPQSNKRRQELRGICQDQGICKNCRKRKAVLGKKWCSACCEYYKQYRVRLRAKGLCKCGRRPVDNRRNCELCRQKSREYNRKLRDEVFAAYGGYRCKCCGEKTPEFLQIDHINNDGAEHRRILGTTSIYYWLKKAGFPKGFQVLCANCNYAKARYGYCPHRQDMEVNCAPNRRIEKSRS